MHTYLLERITAVALLGGFRLRITFADGFTADLDLSCISEFGPAFASLADPAEFARVQVHYDTLEWPDELDLSPGTLRAWCEAGRVLPMPETDQWITHHSHAIRSVA